MEKLFDSTLLNNIAQKLLETQQKVAVAESVTAGMLQNALSNGRDASAFFEGGITAYTINQKIKLLHVDKKEAEAVNCVSQQIANEMAQNVARLFGTNWGIGITGYATAVPESNNQLYAYFAIAHNDAIKAVGKISSTQQKAAIVQLTYTTYVLQKFNSVINP